MQVFKSVLQIIDWHLKFTLIVLVKQISVSEILSYCVINTLILNNIYVFNLNNNFSGAIKIYIVLIQILKNIHVYFKKIIVIYMSILTIDRK